VEVGSTAVGWSVGYWLARRSILRPFPDPIEHRGRVVVARREAHVAGPGFTWPRGSREDVRQVEVAAHRWRVVNSGSRGKCSRSPNFFYAALSPRPTASGQRWRRRGPEVAATTALTPGTTHTLDLPIP
jgi:hypothetical protein